MNATTPCQTFADSLAKAESRYLHAKQKFIEEAVADPATAVALGSTVVERQSHFESLKKAEGYIYGGDYPSVLDAIKAAIDYFRTSLVRSSVKDRSSSCDLSNGVEYYERKGVHSTVQVLEQCVQAGQ